MGSTRAAVLKFLRNANPYVGLMGGSRYGTRLLRTAVAVMLARLSLMAIAHSEVPGPCKLFASHLSERRAHQPLCNGMCEAGRHNDSGTALPIQDVPAFRSSDVPTTLIEAHMKMAGRFIVGEGTTCSPGAQSGSGSTWRRAIARMFGEPQACGIRLLARERDQTCDVIDSAAREQSASYAIKSLKKGSRERRMQDVPTDTKKRAPSSRVLQEVIRRAPPEYVTVGWLTSTLHRHSFGIIMLCLGLLATTPVGSTVPGLILAVMAVQLIVGRGEPVFPHFVMTRRLPTKQLLRLGGRAIHVLKYLEKALHPRWPMTFLIAKYAVGVTILLLTAVLLLTPVPLSNVAPAMVISLISLAYVEEDGLLLSVALLAAIILVGIAAAAVWGTIVGAVLISA